MQIHKIRAVDVAIDAKKGSPAISGGDYWMLTFVQQYILPLAFCYTFFFHRYSISSFCADRKKQRTLRM